MDARQVIYNELSTKVVGHRKLAGGTLMIVCPFHHDKTPSCGVNLRTGSSLPLGYFNCLGCGSKGSWNKLAKKLNLTTIKDWELNFSGNPHQRDRKSEDEITQKAIVSKEMIDWPEDMSWRGYSGELIRKLGGLLYNDELRDEMLLFFPVTVNNKYIGGIKALLDKPKKGPSYINSKGDWVKTSGLLGYQYVQKVVRRKAYTSIVLVEGPRDVMRLLKYKIPSVAMLGVENISKKKIMKILSISSNIKRLYVMPDNDKAGYKMYNTIKNLSKDLVEVKMLKLPQDFDENGKLLKLDPDSCSLNIIKSVKTIIDGERIS